MGNLPPGGACSDADIVAFLNRELSMLAAQGRLPRPLMAPEQPCLSARIHNTGHFAFASFARAEDCTLALQARTPLAYQPTSTINTSTSSRSDGAYDGAHPLTACPAVRPPSSVLRFPASRRVMPARTPSPSCDPTPS